jgi:hypothetical protein
VAEAFAAEVVKLLGVVVVVFHTSKYHLSHRCPSTGAWPLACAHPFQRSVGAGLCRQMPAVRHRLQTGVHDHFVWFVRCAQELLLGPLRMRTSLCDTLVSRVAFHPHVGLQRYTLGQLMCEFATTVSALRDGCDVI